jgi:hypothetical protein
VASARTWVSRMPANASTGKCWQVRSGAGIAERQRCGLVLSEAGRAKRNGSGRSTGKQECVATRSQLRSRTGLTETREGTRAIRSLNSYRIGLSQFAAAVTTYPRFR